MSHGSLSCKCKTHCSGRDSEVSNLTIPLNYSLLLLHRSRKDEIGEEIFDMLLSFTDFLAFKQMFLDYKAVSS